MKYSYTTYIIIAIVSFLILSAVQLTLTYNTYELKNERYYFSEKKIIHEVYSRSIANDKFFPGGQKIIDSFVLKNMYYMEKLHKQDTAAFNVYKQKLADSIFTGLRNKESIAGFLSQLKKMEKIPDSLEYALMFVSLDLMFGDKKYVSFYNNNEKYGLIPKSIQEKEGVRIGGTLRKLNKQNLASSYTVSSPADYSYRITFALYAEPVNRQAAIFSQMSFTLFLSLFSILTIVLLFFVTFRNWVRQKKLSEMKSDFINNITHELHTPLSAIIVANKNLQNEKITEKKENIRPLSDVIQRQSERLKALIDEVLDITATKKLILKKKKLSVHNLLDEILLDYRLNLSESNISLSFNKGATDDVVALDQFHFTSMILNILDNATKYNNKELKEIVVSTSNDDKNNLQITIADNGIGMSKETARHIFEKFYRINNHQFNHTKGLGLGLYYVNQCVHEHNWRIEVESKPEKGSSFIINIPLRTQAA